MDPTSVSPTCVGSAGRQKITRLKEMVCVRRSYSLRSTVRGDVDPVDRVRKSNIFSAAEVGQGAEGLRPSQSPERRRSSESHADQTSGRPWTSAQINILERQREREISPQPCQYRGTRPAVHARNPEWASIGHASMCTKRGTNGVGRARERGRRRRAVCTIWCTNVRSALINLATGACNTPSMAP